MILWSDIEKSQELRRRELEARRQIERLKQKQDEALEALHRKPNRKIIIKNIRERE